MNSMRDKLFGTDGAATANALKNAVQARRFLGNSNNEAAEPSAAHRVADVLGLATNALNMVHVNQKILLRLNRGKTKLAFNADKLEVMKPEEMVKHCRKHGLKTKGSAEALRSRLVQLLLQEKKRTTNYLHLKAMRRLGEINEHVEDVVGEWQGDQLSTGREMEDLQSQLAMLKDGMTELEGINEKQCAAITEALGAGYKPIPVEDMFDENGNRIQGALDGGGGEGAEDGTGLDWPAILRAKANAGVDMRDIYNQLIEWLGEKQELLDTLELKLREALKKLEQLRKASECEPRAVFTHRDDRPPTILSGR
jgi:hypothetical protein